MPYSTFAQQREAAELGMWTFLATEVLFFGGLFLAYAVYRYGYPDAFAAAARHTKLLLGTANTAILLTSSFLVAWAVAAARLDAGKLSAALLGIAAMLGMAFLAIKGYEYAQEFREGLFPGPHFRFPAAHAHGAELFFLFYFTATAVHAMHVAIGVVVLLAIAWRAMDGAYSGRDHAPLTVAGLYWHFVDVVWVVLFALIYLPGRGGI